MIDKVLAWALGPIGKVVLVAALVAGWTVFHRVDAARKAVAECQLATTTAGIAAERKRAEEAERIAERARARAEQSETEMAELENVTREIIENVDGEGRCDAIPDDVRERLLRIN